MICCDRTTYQSPIVRPGRRCWRLNFATVTLLTAWSLGGCSSHLSEPTEALTFAFDFQRGPQGFVAGFADYPPAEAASYELTSAYRALPPPLEPQSALRPRIASRACSAVGKRPGLLTQLLILPRLPGIHRQIRSTDPGNAWGEGRTRRPTLAAPPEDRDRPILSGSGSVILAAAGRLRGTARRTRRPTGGCGTGDRPPPPAAETGRNQFGRWRFRSSN